MVLLRMNEYQDADLAEIARCEHHLCMNLERGPLNYQRNKLDTLLTTKTAGMHHNTNNFLKK